MKTRFKISFLGIIALLIMLGGCTDTFNTDQIGTDEELISETAILTAILTDEEEAGILYMREEEKLAHDVYVKIYEKFNHNIFQNIYESEQVHMDTMLMLIDFYGLEDPVTDEPGVFNNPELSLLYDDLIDMVTNYKSALEVGVLIEEKVIIDLKDYMEDTEINKLDQVYGNLLEGSNNHLSSFNRILEKFE